MGQKYFHKTISIQCPEQKQVFVKEAISTQFKDLGVIPIIRKFNKELVKIENFILRNIKTK